MEELLACKTDSCPWLNSKVTSVRDRWKERCPMIMRKMMEVESDIDLLPGECPPAVAEAFVDSQMANITDLKTGEVR